MDVALGRTAWTQTAADWLVLPLTDPVDWSPPLKQLDQALGGGLARLDAAGDLPIKPAATLALRGLSGLAAPRLLLVGLGPTPVKPQTLDRAWTTAFRAIADKPNLRVAALIPPRIAGGPTTAESVQAATVAAMVGSSGQDLFKAEKSKHPFAGLAVVLADAPTAAEEAALVRGRVLGEAVNLTRELVNRPPAEITPAGFALRAERLARELGLACEIWDQPRLVQERMQSLLAVAKGSSEPPRLVKLEHRGAGAGPAQIALVGKGVTFDSGGLSIKPTDGMLTMKCDMAGAATVLGAMSAIAQLKLPVNVIGLMGLVENMPGGSAFKLGDILTARNGVTIEVLNTDAEGRLVLADVLSYAVDLGVERIVDLATLTGACVVALGEDVAGAMTNDQPLCDRVLSAAAAVGEDLWQLPMFDLYDELIKGDVGDIKNTGGRWGGAISAGKFLQRFVAGKPWVHLDIAGPAFASSSKPHREGGGTGAYVRTLVELVTRMSAGRTE
uniref:Probable cytosol aminopeptidase n=1 Tax=Schlesneria paludicola TaxID=360056 RepID=A0A7C2PHJ6_9PLAN